MNRLATVLTLLIGLTLAPSISDPIPLRAESLPLDESSETHNIALDAALAQARAEALTDAAWSADVLLATQASPSRSEAPAAPSGITRRAFVPSVRRGGPPCVLQYPMVIWGFLNNTGSNSAAAMISLAQQTGANLLMYFPYIPGPQADIPYLDMVKTQGIRLVMRLEGVTEQIFNAGNEAAFVTWINAVKNHPSLYGYLVYDEPELHGSAVSQAKVQRVIDLLRQHDPAHPSWLNFGGLYGDPSTNYIQYIGRADIESFDYYPFHGSGSYRTSLTEYDTLVNKFVNDHNIWDAGGTAKAYWSFVQDFRNDILNPPVGEIALSDMLHIVDYARAASPKFDGITYFLASWYGSQSSYPAMLELSSLRTKTLSVSNTYKANTSRYPVVINSGSCDHGAGF